MHDTIIVVVCLIDMSLPQVYEMRHMHSELTSWRNVLGHALSGLTTGGNYSVCGFIILKGVAHSQ